MDLIDATRDELEATKYPEDNDREPARESLEVKKKLHKKLHDIYFTSEAT